MTFYMLHKFMNRIICVFLQKVSNKNEACLRSWLMHLLVYSLIRLVVL